MTDSITGVPPQLPAGLESMIPAYLGRQRWYAGSPDPSSDQMRVVLARTLVLGDNPPADTTLHHLIVESENATYQLLVGERPAGTPAEFLNGQSDAVLGSLDSAYFYDALVHPELARRLLEVVTEGREAADRVRPVGAEQSNTSLVYDDRIIVKVYRRVLAGPNPDIEVTTALSQAGFAHVAPPVATWRLGEWDLAFAQRYLTGGSDGWALALTSLRDLFNSELDDPGEAGGDFAGEAARLGRVTAEMHLAMVRAFGATPGGLTGEPWARLVDSIEDRLGRAQDRLAGAIEAPVADVLRRLRAVADPGPTIRVHGDYHLGQVMETDTGWYVLDFEGEPARPLAERLRSTSALKDIAGMVRSFSYAAHFALTEREPGELDRLGVLADVWERHNRAAYLSGYGDVSGLTGILPAEPRADAVLGAFELDKALYELDYELAYRPEWAPIPLSAIQGLLVRLAG